MTMTTTKNYEDAETDRASALMTRGKQTGTTQDGRLPRITRHSMHIAWRQRGRVTALLAGMAALAVATLGFSSAAAAAGTAPRLERPSVIEDASSSSYFAGYQATPNGGLASASVTFTVPTISCTATDKSDGAAEWTGVYTDTLETQAFVVGYCSSSGPIYSYVFATLARSFVQSGAAPGDVVVASLFQSDTSTWAEIHDLTNGEYWVASNDVNQGDSVVDIGTLTQDACCGSPVPTFSKIKFTNATVNGDYLDFDGPTEFNTLIGGDLLIKAGHLATSATGSSFSDTFKHAS